MGTDRDSRELRARVFAALGILNAATALAGRETP
jgi:hypothetical protein